MWTLATAASSGDEPSRRMRGVDAFGEIAAVERTPRRAGDLGHPAAVAIDATIGHVAGGVLGEVRRPVEGDVRVREVQP